MRHLLVRTEAHLAAHPCIWDDGHLAFASGPNRLGTSDKKSVEAFFGQRCAIAARSGHGSSELELSEHALSNST